MKIEKPKIYTVPIVAFDFDNNKAIRMRIRNGEVEVSYCNATFHCEDLGLAIDGTKYHVGDVCGEFILKGDSLWTSDMSKGLTLAKIVELKTAYDGLVALKKTFPMLPNNYTGWYRKRHVKDWKYI